MLPVNCCSHSDYQNFVVKNLRKYYPNPDSIARSTWDIIDRFWNLDLSYTNEKLKNRYSVCGSKPRTPSCMHRSYLLSLDFKVTSLTEWAAQLKINLLKRYLLNSSYRNWKTLLSPFLKSLMALAGDGTPLVASARERKHRVCDCASKGINDCSCDRQLG